MKQLILTSIAIICLGLTSHAQYDSKGDSIPSKFRPGAMWFFTGWRPASIEKVHKYDRLIFDITYNDWMGDKDLFEVHWASIGLNTNLLFDIPLTKGNTVSIGTGLSHEFHVTRHNGRIEVSDPLGTTNLTPKLPHLSSANSSPS